MWLSADVETGTALVTAVWTFLGLVVTALGTIAVQAMKSRGERPTTGAAIAPTDVTVARYGERIAVVEHITDENTETLEFQDRRIDQGERRQDAVEWFLDHNFPGWRNP